MITPKEFLNILSDKICIRDKELETKIKQILDLIGKIYDVNDNSTTEVIHKNIVDMERKSVEELIPYFFYTKYPLYCPDLRSEYDTGCIFSMDNIYHTDSSCVLIILGQILYNLIVDTPEKRSRYTETCVKLDIQVDRGIRSMDLDVIRSELNEMKEHLENKLSEIFMR